MEFLIVIAIIGLVIGMILTWVFGMVEVARSNQLTDLQKVAGILGIFFFPFIGTVVYYLIAKPRLERKRIATNEFC